MLLFFRHTIPYEERAPIQEQEEMASQGKLNTNFIGSTAIQLRVSSSEVLIYSQIFLSPRYAYI